MQKWAMTFPFFKRPRTELREEMMGLFQIYLRQAKSLSRISKRQPVRRSGTALLRDVLSLKRNDLNVILCFRREESRNPNNLVASRKYR